MARKNETQEPVAEPTEPQEPAAVNEAAAVTQEPGEAALDLIEDVKAYLLDPAHTVAPAAVINFGDDQPIRARE